jgi:hypothetical protein
MNWNEARPDGRIPARQFVRTANALRPPGCLPSYAYGGGVDLGGSFDA